MVSFMGQILEIDVHGLLSHEAKLYVEQTINACDKNIKEVHVIHGYRSGRALLNTIRKQVHSKRIKQVVVELNPGVTVFLLN